MEKTLQKVCDDNGLTGISAMMASAKTGNISVFVHWESKGFSHCAMGVGSTYNGALTVALADMQMVIDLTEAA